MKPVELHTFAAPLSLTPSERAVLDSWPFLARQRFEFLASGHEFVDGMTPAAAEAEAFAKVQTEQAAAARSNR